MNHYEIMNWRVTIYVIISPILLTWRVLLSNLLVDLSIFLIENLIPVVFCIERLREPPYQGWESMLNANEERKRSECWAYWKNSHIHMPIRAVYRCISCLSPWIKLLTYYLLTYLLTKRLSFYQLRYQFSPSYIIIFVYLEESDVDQGRIEVDALE